ncbi:MAG: hypothetical protein ACRCZA_01520, partial [Shewanella sp.]|uniref:hypothetical protein n=1 Tax=Shewanella sp. TaxID=50422 RepID=UPI003F3BDCB8
SLGYMAGSKPNTLRHNQKIRASMEQFSWFTFSMYALKLSVTTNTWQVPPVGGVLRCQQLATHDPLMRYALGGDK